ncbi:MAG TPA: tetratricopeptide repeat protein [Bryobacteraceae bacterium]|jgi:hypothetical protein|nr:tetratricopeptide repeat protein [Bryobacteraceae bacterium]
MRTAKLSILACLTICNPTINAQITGLSSAPGGSEIVAFFSGTVTLQDGTRPPASVLIQQVCDGRLTATAWTDTGGRFSFMLGGRGSAPVATDTAYDPAMPAYFDRSTRGSNQYGNPIASLAHNCEIQAVLPGFRSDRVGVAVRTSLDNNRIGTIVLHPVTKAEALTVSATTLQAPVRARKACDKGMADMKAGKWRAAVANFNKSVAIYPTYALAWYELGLAFKAQSDAAGAVDAWKHSLASDGHYVTPYQELCALAYQNGDWNDLAEYSHNWILLNAEDFPAAYLYNAFAATNLHHLSDAEAMAREGLRIDKDHKYPRLSFLLGFVLLKRQQYAESAKYLRAYLQMVPGATDAAAVREQIARLDQASAMASSADGPPKP